MVDVWVPIIVSVVTGIATVAGVIISTANSLKMMDAKLEKNQAVLEAHLTEQIKHLQQQVEKHNSVIDRTFKLETKSRLQEAEINRQAERINKLERGCE